MIAGFIETFTTWRLSERPDIQISASWHRVHGQEESQSIDLMCSSLLSQGHVLLKLRSLHDQSSKESQFFLSYPITKISLCDDEG